MRAHFQHLHFDSFPMILKNVNATCFDFCNQTMKFWESRRIPKSPFRECEFHPHSHSLKVGLQQIYFEQQDILLHVQPISYTDLSYHRFCQIFLRS
jgi:hypothetical protein